MAMKVVFALGLVCLMAVYAQTDIVTQMKDVLDKFKSLDDKLHECEATTSGDCKAKFDKYSEAKNKLKEMIKKGGPPDPEAFAKFYDNKESFKAEFEKFVGDCCATATDDLKSLQDAVKKVKESRK